MENIFRITFALAAIVAFASCHDEINNPAAEQGQDNAGVLPSVEFVPMTFSTAEGEAIESKTTYTNRNVYWEEDDEISVFSVGSEGVNSKGTVSTLSNDRTSAQFTALADPGAESYYAVYPYYQTNACDAAGNLTVNIPSEQTAVQSGFMSGSNTSVACSVQGSEGDVLQFRNVTALIGISFATDADAAATKSITIRAKKNDTEYWGLTGTGKVGFNSDMEPVIIEEGDVEYVTLNAPGGAFVREHTMFVPVYAVGDVAGFEVTYLGQDGKEYVKTNSTAATLERNKILNFGAIADPYDPLPHTITFTVDFSLRWPFNETIVESTLQAGYQSGAFLGESYTYTYDRYPEPDDGREMKTDFAFNICKGIVTSTSYCYLDKQYLSLGQELTERGGSILLPGIEDRYLTEVTVVKYDYSNDRISLADPDEGVRTELQFIGNNGNDDNFITFTIYADKCKIFTTRSGGVTKYSENIKAELAKRYEILARNNEKKYNDVKIKSITLTYSKTNPGNCPTE